jgi:hypothetical protein
MARDVIYTSSTPASGGTASWRGVHPITRVVLLTGSALVFVAGLQLYVFSSHTDDLFAWTIAVPLTAAVIGGFYWGALPLAIGCALQHNWAYARAGVLGITAFLWATFAATMLHIDKFHIHGEAWAPQSAAWFWIVVYVAVPIGMTIGVVMQFVTPGDDPPRAAPFAGWYRSLLALMGVAITSVAIALIVAPVATGRRWPWALTPLTARALGAWILGLGVVWLCAAYENDYPRIRLVLASYVWLGALQMLALARYADDLHPGRRTTALVIAILVSMAIAAVGMLGISRARPRAGQPA